METDSSTSDSRDHRNPSWIVPRMPLGANGAIALIPTDSAFSFFLLLTYSADSELRRRIERLDALRH